MQKLKSLEGLRGLAAFVVVIFHLLINYFPAIIFATPKQVHFSHNIEIFFATTPLNVFYNGNFAVCIFFVLSGFVLSYKFFMTKNNQAIIATAFKRYFRLAIPVLFSLIPIYLFTVINPTASDFKNIQLLDVLYEGAFSTFFKYKATYNTVLWTMSFEFFGSFLVFGFCLIFGHNRNRIFAYLFLVFIFWNSYYLAFITGMFLSDIYAQKGNYLKNDVLKIVLVALAIFFGSYPDTIGIVEGSIGIHSTIYSFLNFGADAAVFYHILGSTILLLVLLNSQKMNEFFSREILQFLGKCSFALYLMHAFIVVYVSHTMFNFIKIEFGLGYKVNFLVTSAISILIIFLITYFTYKFVDQPAIRFSEFMYTTVFSENEKNDLLDLRFLSDKIFRLKEKNLISRTSSRTNDARDAQLKDHDEL